MNEKTINKQKRASTILTHVQDAHVHYINTHVQRLGQNSEMFLSMIVGKYLQIQDTNKNKNKNKK